MGNSPSSLVEMPTVTKASSGNSSRRSVAEVEQPRITDSDAALAQEKKIPTGEKTETSVVIKDGVQFNSRIPEHLSKFDGFTQKDGIKGTHDLNEFLSHVEKYQAKITKQESRPTEGITHFEYQVPAKARDLKAMVDANDEIIYKKRIYEKTSYDPNVISPSKIIELGEQAVIKGYEEAMVKKSHQYTAEADGIKFRVYLDPETGIISNYHPE